MSFPVLLQSTTAPTNAVDKNPTLEATATGILKIDTSIIDPVILIDFDASLVPETIVKKINYAYIETFGRYYYVTNIIVQSTRLWEVHMHVDVLMTYRDEIRAQTAIVSRQANQYNLYLDDGWFMAYQNPRHQLKLFSNATPFETQEFVLVVAGS